MIWLSAFQNKDGCSAVSHGRPCPWGYSCAQRHPFWPLHYNADSVSDFGLNLFLAPLTVAGIYERWESTSSFSKSLIPSVCFCPCFLSPAFFMRSITSAEVTSTENMLTKGNIFRSYLDFLMLHVIYQETILPQSLSLWSWFLCCTCPPVSHVKNPHSLRSSKDVHSLESHHQKLQCQLCHLFCVLALFWLNSHQKQFEMG